MKLFVIAALIAVAAAGRLEHLERAYLPPFHGSNDGLDSQGSFGSHSAHGSFGANSGALGSAGLGQYGQNGAFGAATTNQYLPPDHGPSNSAPQFAGSLEGFGSPNYQSQQNSGLQAGQQYAVPSIQYGAPQVSSAYQEPPQQAFDEQTGYHY